MNICITGLTLAEAEKQVILHNLKICQGVKAKTAEMIGCSIRTLDTKLEQYAKDETNAKQRDDAQEEKNRGFIHRQRFGTCQAENSFYGTPSGVCMEPSSDALKESPMPLQKQKEVQTVLPQQTASGGKNRRS